MTDQMINMRRPVEGDFALIADTWSNTLLGKTRRNRGGVGPLSKMNRRDYYACQSALMDSILENPETEVLVSCWDDDENLITGWVCGAPSRRLLHFIYVKGLYRREGVGTALMARFFGHVGQGAAPVVVTHWTRCVPFYEKKWGLTYNPYVLHEVVK